MHGKSITILLALTMCSLTLARGIAPTDEDPDNDNNNNEEMIQESDAKSVPDPIIASSPSSTLECASVASSPTDRTLASTDHTRLGSMMRALFDKMDDNKHINIGHHMNLDRIRNGLMSRANSQHSGSNIWQILDDFDWHRPSPESHEILASIIPHLIDSFTIPPQMQYVDNTLRLMAIKNSMDDLLAKIFPNLHMIHQHPTEQNNNNSK